MCAELRVQRGLGFTWTPTVCRIMAFRAIFRCLRLLSYILLGVQVGLYGEFVDAFRSSVLYFKKLGF